MTLSNEGPSDQCLKTTLSMQLPQFFVSLAIFSISVGKGIPRQGYLREYIISGPRKNETTTPIRAIITPLIMAVWKAVKNIGSIDGW